MAQKKAYAASDILAQLDQSAEDFTFPMLDNGYVHLVTVRLHGYRDGRRWALVIECVGVGNRNWSHGAISNCLHHYGNCLNPRPEMANEDFIGTTGDIAESATFEEEYPGYVCEEARAIRIRDQIAPFNLYPESFEKKGIVLEKAPRVMAHELMRSLLPDHRKLMLATEEELRRRISPDLPEVIRLDQWHHPNLVNGELPSQSETFRMVAEVLASGDTSRYRPTKVPNTHWKNWPDGGRL